MNLKQPSSPGRTWCGPPILALAAVGLVLAMAVPAQALSVLVTPGADLAEGSVRYHPDGSLGLPSTEFNVFTDSGLPSAWTLGASMATPFSNVDVGGTFYSNAYRHNTDGHTLFTYQIHNSGETVIRDGNIAGFASGWQWLDSGIIDLGGDEAFDQGDVLKLRRPSDGAPQFAFAFETDAVGNLLLQIGETSSWFYAVTDAPSWQVGQATVQDSGSSASPVAVLVPVPEPVTLAGLVIGVGCLGRYVRRRRWV